MKSLVLKWYSELCLLFSCPHAHKKKKQLVGTLAYDEKKSAVCLNDETQIIVCLTEWFMVL